MGTDLASGADLASDTDLMTDTDLANAGTTHSVGYRFSDGAEAVT